MNIIIYADRLEAGGGLETHVLTQVNELLKRGHKILLTANAVIPKFLEGIEDKNNNFLFKFWSEDKFKDIEGFNPDIIHSHPFTAIFRGYDVAERLNIPFFITMHGSYDFGVDRSTLGFKVTNKVSRIIAVSNAVKNILDKCCATPEKVQVIHNGLDLEKFKPTKLNLELANSLNINLNWKTITIVSRFEDNKERTILQFLDCSPEIAKIIKGLNVVIVGDGIYYNDIIQKSKDVSNENLNIQIVGRQFNIVDYLSLANLFLGIGRASLEALACKIPVFGMGSNGFSKLITDDISYEALLDNSKSKNYSNQELINIISNLLLNDELLLSSLNHYNIFKEKFDIRNTTNQLEEVYFKYIERGL